MKMIHALIINRNAAAKFAGKVVASMIKFGCDPETMRGKGIPVGVFHGVLGGQKHIRGESPDGIAREEVGFVRRDYLFKKS